MPATVQAGWGGERQAAGGQRIAESRVRCMHACCDARTAVHRQDAPAALDEGGQQRLGQRHGAEVIDGHEAQLGLVARGQHALALRDARVVDEAVEPARRRGGQDLTRPRWHALRFTHVELDDRRLFGRSQPLLHRLELAQVSGSQHEVRALRGKCKCERLTNAGARSGHQDGLASPPVGDRPQMREHEVRVGDSEDEQDVRDEGRSCTTFAPHRHDSHVHDTRHTTHR